MSKKIGRPIIDLTEREVRGIRVLSFSGDKDPHGQFIYNCECLTCKSQFRKRATSIRSGRPRCPKCWKGKAGHPDKDPRLVLAEPTGVVES